MGARGPKAKYTDVSCPNENCPLFGITGKGNVVSRGTRTTKSGDEVRIFRCNRCGFNFNSRTGTAYQHLHCSQDEYDDACKHLVKGCGIRDTADLTSHSPVTIIKWTKRAGRQCRGVSMAHEDDMRPANLQFDELTAMIFDRPVPEGDGTFRTHGPWVWTAIEPNSRYWMGALVGDRTEETGKSFLNSVWDKMVEGHIPTMTSDGYSVYKRAIDERFSVLVGWYYPITDEIRYKLVPHKKLRYGQVIKRLKDGKLEIEGYKEVYGHVPPQDFNTSYIERLNLTIRMGVARMSRKTIKFSKKSDMLQDAMDLMRATYNYCRIHASLGFHGKRDDDTVRKATPAMKQGLSDHVWSMRELMSFLYRQNIHYKV